MAKDSFVRFADAVATGMAAGIALGVLLVAWYIVSRPSVPGWQIASIAVLATAVLAGGAIFAVVEDDEGEASGEEPAAAASPDDGAAADGAPGSLAVSLGDNFFEFEGETGPTIAVAAGEEITIDLTNGGLAIHNMHIAGTDNEFGVAICKSGEEEPCSDPELFLSGDTGSITFSFDEPGTFIFRCDFHPIEMTGTLEVQ